MADDQNAAARVNYGEGLRLKETWSRCVTECGAHNFELPDYSLLDGMGAGKFVRSSKFSVGGYDWKIRFYPDGEKIAPAAPTSYASAYLIYLSETLETITGKLALTMLDKDGKVVASKELPGQLERALKDGKDADITLLVGGREFGAHRFMLAARSPAFHAQLLGPTGENKNTPRVIEVVDMEPAIFEMLLHFIYTDSLLPPCDGEEGYGAPKMQQLLVAADRYGLDRLKAMCEEKLCRSIDVKTFTSTLALANEHCCERPKNACDEFMSKPGRVSDVLSSDGFKRLIASCTPLPLEDKTAPKKKLKFSLIN
ncbi:BTB/POZ and MATH domain-containing protein 2 [Brachypodium distachyon]|uniref:BTB/POZ and MATH domain-containing protein 2 n=1 Tax=Brachypodium distachyon TaxID=15368 RepID=UPI00052FED09|nr:BTB/POZ and MATH domain-containing protein 2 [Brachypodium distachyon]|eukprot:XP_010227283.1 BTB/POZ and MATH domain-containing protein 2 [Brachypodium distachyon]